MGWKKISWFILVIGLWFPSVGVSAQTPLTIQGHVAYRGIAGNFWIDREYTLPQALTYWILGAVTLEDGEGLAGVSIELSNGQSTLTDARGVFFFAYLAPGSYVLTPVRSGYAFDPATLAIEIVDGDQDVQITARLLSEQGAGSAPIDQSWGAVFRILLWISLFLAAVAIGSRLWQNAQKPGVESAPPPQLSSGLEPQPDPLPSQDVQELLREGIAAIRSQDVTSGMNKLKGVIQIAPDHAEAWLWLGWAAFQDHQVRTAQRCFLRAKKLGHPQADKAFQWLETQKCKPH